MVNEFRSLLVEAMIQSRNEDEPLEPILEELDRAFIGYLSVRDRAAAAATLLQTVQFLGGKDWPKACETGFKLIELFSGSGNKEVIETAREAYGFLFTEMSEEDPRFVELCVQYAKFVQNTAFPPESAVNTVLEIDEALDGEHNSTAIEILCLFLEKRTDFSGGRQDSLRSRLAVNQLYVGNYKDAIATCIDLVVDAADTSRLDYTLWCGEAFRHLRREETAAMFFREVVRALGNAPDDKRATAAQVYLNQTP